MNIKNAAFFYKEHKRTQRTPHSFKKNTKERKNVAFFWKERLPNPAEIKPASLLEPSLSLCLNQAFLFAETKPFLFLLEPSFSLCWNQAFLFAGTKLFSLLELSFLFAGTKHFLLEPNIVK